MTRFGMTDTWLYRPLLMEVFSLIPIFSPNVSEILHQVITNPNIILEVKKMFGDPPSPLDNTYDVPGSSCSIFLVLTFLTIQVRLSVRQEIMTQVESPLLKYKQFVT